MAAGIEARPNTISLMTNDELIRNPTIENLTRFAELNAAAKFENFAKFQPPYGVSAIIASRR
jgi:hypothetical protein